MKRRDFLFAALAASSLAACSGAGADRKLRLLVAGDSHAAFFGEGVAEVLCADLVSVAFPGSSAAAIAGEFELVGVGPPFDICVFDGGSNDMVSGFGGMWSGLVRCVEAAKRVAALVVYVNVLPLAGGVLADEIAAACDLGRGLCARSGVGYVDASSVVAAMGESAFRPDGVHLTDEAYAVVSGFVGAEVLRSVGGK